MPFKSSNINHTYALRYLNSKTTITMTTSSSNHNELNRQYRYYTHIHTRAQHMNPVFRTLRTSWAGVGEGWWWSVEDLLAVIGFNRWVFRAVLKAVVD